MNLARPLVVASALAAFASVSSTQTTSPYVEARRIASPTTTHPALKQHVRAADLTGDLDVDLLYSDAGNLMMMYAPGKMTAFVDLQRTANDFDVLPPTGPGEAFQIVAVNSTGIALLSDYDAGVFTASPRPSTLWNGAKRVHVTDLFDNDTPDLIGVHADGEAIVRADGIRDATPVFSFFDVGSTILDYTVADWTETSDREVLVLTDDGLMVYDADGTLLDSVIFAAEKGFVASMRQAGFGHARAVLVYRNSGTTYLRVADSTVDEGAQTLPGLSAVAIAITDADEDGDGDLVLVPSSAADLYYWPNQSDGNPPGSGATFPLSTYALVGLDPTSRYQQAESGLRDFDNDGDADLLQYLAASDELVYCANDTIDPASQLVTFDMLPGGELDGSILLDATGSETLVELIVNVTVPVKPYVEVTAWSQPATPGLTEPIDPVPAFQGVFGVTSGSAELHIVLGELTDVLDNVYNLELRGVDFVSGNVVDPGPYEFAAFGLPSDVTDEIEALYGTGMLTTTILLDAGGGPQPFYGNLDGREITPIVTCTPNTPPPSQPPSPTTPPPM